MFALALGASPSRDRRDSALQHDEEPPAIDSLAWRFREAAELGPVPSCSGWRPSGRPCPPIDCTAKCKGRIESLVVYDTRIRAGLGDRLAVFTQLQTPSVHGWLCTGRTRYSRSTTTGAASSIIRTGGTGTS